MTGNETWITLVELRKIGVKRAVFNGVNVVEVEFFEPVEPEDPEPTERPGFARRQKDMAKKKSELEVEAERRTREHNVLFASTGMVPHITPKE